jgi:uncharacterized protein involved in exopolysaccharide biosynthesis
MFTLRDACRGLSRQRRWAIGFFVGVNLLVVIGTLVCPKSYRSQAQLFVRMGRENVRLDATAALGQGPVVATPNSRESEMNSVAQVVGSRLIIEKVVDAIGPSRILEPSDDVEAATDTSGFSLGAIVGAVLPLNNVSQREMAIIQFGKKLEVEAIPRTNVISIAFETGTPKLAQEVVDRIVESYVEEHIRLNRTGGAHDFLSEQIARANDELNCKENQLKTLRSETRIADPLAQRAVLVARIARLEDELINARATATAAEVEVAELERALQGLSETSVMTQTTGAGNEAIDRMREQLYVLQIQQEDLLTKYTNDHYKVRQINEQIAQAQAILSDEADQRTEKTEGPNAMYEATRLELIRKKPTLAAQRARTEKVTQQLRQVRDELEQFNTDSLRVTALEREVSILDQNFRKYAYNLEQARIDQSLEDEHISNITVAQPATFNEKPVRPNKLINLVLGLMLGTIGGVSLAVVREFYDTSLVAVEAPRAAVGGRFHPTPVVLH